MEDSIKKLVIFKYTQRRRAFLVFILCAQYSLVALDSALPKDDAVLGSRISFFLFSLLITFFFKKKAVAIIWKNYIIILNIVTALRLVSARSMFPQFFLLT